MAGQEEIYIAGVGVVSPFGVGVREYWRSLIDGRGGLTVCDPFRLGREFEAPFGLLSERRSAANICSLAIDEALAEAGTSIPELPKFAIYLASAHGESTVLSDIVDYVVEIGHPPSDARIECVDDLLSERLDAHTAGRAHFIRNVKAACASANVALSWAMNDLRSHRIDAAIVASVDTLSRAGTAGFKALGALAKTNIHPFSRHRDGTLIGEGAAALLLTKYPVRHPLRLLSVGLSGDLDRHPVQSNIEGVGIELAIRQALALGDVTPDQIDVINYHATGTEQNDRAEANACNRVFSDRIPIGYALKPAIGHSMGAAAGMALVAAVMMIRTRVIPPTLNSDPQDAEFDLPLVQGRAIRAPVKCVLTHGFGFGGINSAALLST